MDDIIKQLMEEADQLREVVMPSINPDIATLNEEANDIMVENFSEEEEETGDESWDDYEEIEDEDNEEEEIEELEEETPKPESSIIYQMGKDRSKKTKELEYAVYSEGGVIEYYSYSEMIKMNNVDIVSDSSDNTWIKINLAVKFDNRWYNPFTSGEVCTDNYGNKYLKNNKGNHLNIIKFREDATYYTDEIIARETYRNHSNFKGWHDLRISTIDPSLSNRYAVNGDDLKKYRYEITSDGISRIETTEEVRERVSKLPYFEQVIKSIYQDNWSIEYINPSIKHAIVVKFDKFIITNEESSEHEIIDLYVILPIISGTPKLQFQSDLCGCRGVITTEEYAGSYKHSHLDGEWNEISHFCLGSGPLPTYIANFNLSSSENDLFCVLYNLKVYVEWESIEGTPYRYMRDLGRKKINPNSNSGLNSSGITEIYKKYINSNLDVPIKLENGELTLDPDIIERQILKFAIEWYGTDAQALKNLSLNEYYYDRGRSAVAKEMTSDDPLFTYKGEKIYVKVIKKEQEEETENFPKEYVSHPKISEWFISHAKRRIQRYYINQAAGANSRKSKTYYI